MTITMNSTPSTVSRAQQRIDRLTQAANVYAQEDQRVRLSHYGIERDTAVAMRLGYVTSQNVQPGHEAHIDRLAVPYWTRAGVTDIRFICTLHADCDEQGHPHISTLPESTGHLYNVGALSTSSPSIVLVEHELDAVLLTQLDVDAVALPGPGAYKPHHARILEDFDTVWVLGSGTLYGRTFVSTIAPHLRGAIPATCPDGHTVRSLYTQQGEGAVAALLGGAA